LATSVTVEDHTAWRAAGEERGGEGFDDESGAQVVGPGVAHDLSGV
jgi:hypothetical protein